MVYGCHCQRNWPKEQLYVTFLCRLTFRLLILFTSSTDIMCLFCLFVIWFVREETDSFSFPLPYFPLCCLVRVRVRSGSRVRVGSVGLGLILGLELGLRFGLGGMSGGGHVPHSVSYITQNVADEMK